MLTRIPMKWFSTNEIKPKGWMRRQLELQAEGLFGNLHKVWPDIRDSKWIGGDREGWERVPYWLDGFIPMAYFLEDEEMIATAKKYVDFILEKQISDPKDPCWDGWICPVKNEEELLAYDDWANYLICKVLILYYDCSGDERIPGVVEKILRNLHFRSAHFAPRDWASFRWYEALITIYWMYERTGEEWLLEIVDYIWQDSADYKKIYDRHRDITPRGRWTLGYHVVNVAMSLKSDALLCRYFNTKGYDTDPDEFAEYLFSRLEKDHGTVTGHFNGDECISGTSPVHGTELCGIVEAMYSYEWLFALTDKDKWLDRLEKLAFNALPAGISDDMWVRQYDQMSNQIACMRYENGHSPFMTNGIEGGMFGLETNYGCCTANFGQGWSKLVLSAFMKSEKGVASAAIVPSELKFANGDANVKITLDTEYPFNNVLTYTIETDKPTEFEFSYRVPGFAKCADVNGAYKAPGRHKINRTWEGKTTITVTLDFETELVERPNELFAFRRGPLVYSMPIGEKWEKVEFTDENSERKFPYCDYLISPTTDWQYGFADTKAEFVYNGISDVPFSSKTPACELRVKLAPIEWGYKEGTGDLTAREEPISRTPTGNAVDAVLYPFGCPKLRMTELPILDK